MVPQCAPPPDRTPSQSPPPPEETVGTVSGQDAKAGGSSESEQEGTDVKMDEGTVDTNVSTCQTVEPPGPDVNQDKNTDTKETTDADTDTDTKTDAGVDAQQDKVSPPCKCSVSTATDLDEMMDIGTVDQVDQEAQMKDEGQNPSMDASSACSPASSSTGRVKQKSSEVFPDKTNVPSWLEESPGCLFVSVASRVSCTGMTSRR